MPRWIFWFLILLAACGDSSPNFSLSVPGTSVTLGSFTTVTVSVSFSPGASNTVTLSLEGVPQGISGSFNPSTLSSGNPTSQLTILASSGVATGTYDAVVRGTSGGASNTASFRLSVLGGGGGGGSGGSISGTVSIGTGTAPTADLDFVPGDIIVKFKAGIGLQSVQTLSAGGALLQRVRNLSIERVSLYRASLDPQGTLDAIADLAARADVEYAHPNYRFYPARTPNDPLYNQQWHYPAINLPQAWDIERGQSNPVTVAVIDTGQLLQHPDFDRNRILPGFDMISDPRNARDGDGRDNNPEDDGDLISPTQSSYHGTHVAGTILAHSDNNLGVAGVTWGARLLPVRVLGVQGGDLVDITDGMLWAAGLPVAGVPTNPNPAAVINMSLGGSRPCSQVPLYQEVINRINAQGRIIVAAAGNNAENAANFVPASCSGVITVGATGPSGGRAPYSNFGGRIDLMAPGGNVAVNLGGVQAGGGVLSPLKSDASGQFNYEFYNGTSMAAPHVAGLIALMKSARPSLTRAEALDILRRTARPLTQNQCQGETSPSRPTPPPGITAGDCGAGLVDALAAIQAVGGAPVGSFTLSTTPSSLAIAPGGNASVVVGIERVGGFSGPVSLTLQGAPTGVSGTFTPNPAAGAASTLALSVAGNVPPGQYPMTVQGNAGSQSARAALVLTVGSANLPTLKDTFIAALFWTGNDFDVNRSLGIFLTADTRTANYILASLGAGQYAVAGWKDINGNSEVDGGDYFGVFRVNGQLALVQPPATGINYNLELISGTTAEIELEPALQALKKVLQRR
ncbi:S8 family serine peptidase [Meiothermus hypogaeus]|uniref:Serine protease n=2 Tax=Meiothermus hypogaeus TaxID=884155 RepID=A0A511QZ64_9DEIN|nr:S8 family serine peptidase [Meiothermus hypogaeus]RIH77138.1 Extracellular basic protease [Meiothermus hypogaeus]GEM82648.1 serine protease [Meiothermus hypogaeus NBRC 106114]